MALVINRLSLRRVKASEAGEALPEVLHDLWWDVNVMMPWEDMVALQKNVEGKSPLEAADMLIPSLVNDWNIQFEKEDGELVRADISGDVVRKLPTELVVYMLMDEKNGMMSFLGRVLDRKRAA